MITREQVESLFDRCRKNQKEGRASWSIDGPCKWSFFFVDTDRTKLLRLAKYLEQCGYESIGFLDPTSGDAPRAVLFLRADRIEKHSLDSLLSRNAELYAMAEQFELDDYDGMDVGSVDGP